MRLTRTTLVTKPHFNRQFERALDLMRKRTSTGLNLKFFFAYSRNIFKPASFIVLRFTCKISAVIFIGEGLALFRSQND